MGKMEKQIEIDELYRRLNLLTVAPQVFIEEGVPVVVVLGEMVNLVDQIEAWARMVLAELPLIEARLESTNDTRHFIEMVRKERPHDVELMLKAQAYEDLLSDPEAATKKFEALRKKAEKILGM